MSSAILILDSARHVIGGLNAKPLIEPAT